MFILRGTYLQFCFACLALHAHPHHAAQKVFVSQQLPVYTVVTPATTTAGNNINTIIVEAEHEFMDEITSESMEEVIYEMGRVYSSALREGSTGGADEDNGVNFELNAASDDQKQAVRKEQHALMHGSSNFEKPMSSSASSPSTANIAFEKESKIVTSVATTQPASSYTEQSNTSSPAPTATISPSFSTVLSPSAEPSTSYAQTNTTTSSAPHHSHSFSPTAIATIKPTTATLLPSKMTSQAPSKVPSQDPYVNSSVLRTALSTKMPSQTPSNVPSQDPTLDPSGPPTLLSSTVPSSAPSKVPSREPILASSAHPSMHPSDSPTILHSSSLQPTLSRQPIIELSNSPSSLPSASPTARPTQAIVNTAITECDVIYVSSIMDEDTVLLFVEKMKKFLYDRFLLTVPPMEITSIEMMSQKLRSQDAESARARRELQSSINRVAFNVSASQAPPLNDDFDERVANIINAQGSFLVASLKNEDEYFYAVNTVEALEPPKDEYIQQAQSEPSGDNALTIVAVVGGVLCFIVVGAILMRSIKLK